MPIYEYFCFHCGEDFFEKIVPLKDCDKTLFCSKCKRNLTKIPPRGTCFKLKYNNKTDMCDWEGNKSRYWDEYKKQKAEGKNVRIPELDGE